MTNKPTALRTLAAALFAGLLCAIPASAQSWAQFQSPKPNPLPMIQRSVIQDVQGRMGRVAMDPKSGQLYVAALRSGSVYVLDPTMMKVVQIITEMPEPQGVKILEDQRRLVVSCGDGSVRVFTMDDTGELKPERAVSFGGEGDALGYDPKAKRVWFGHGKYVSSFDPATGEKGKDIALPGMADGLAVEQRGARVFVNVGSEGKVIVINKESNAIETEWALKDAKGNNPIDLDEDSGRVFVASRNPGKLIVLNIKDGAEIARLDIGDDADDLWYDKLGKRIYTSCGGGAGEVAIVMQNSADNYTIGSREATTAGARTSVLVPSKRRYIVIAPKSGDSPCFIFIYVIAP